MSGYAQVRKQVNRVGYAVGRPLPAVGMFQKCRHKRTYVASIPPRRYGVFFEVRADLAWVARSISGGGCCSPAIAHQTLT